MEAMTNLIAFTSFTQTLIHSIIGFYLLNVLWNHKFVKLFNPHLLITCCAICQIGLNSVTMMNNNNYLAVFIIVDCCIVQPYLERVVLEAEADDNEKN